MRYYKSHKALRRKSQSRSRKSNKKCKSLIGGFRDAFIKYICSHFQPIAKIRANMHDDTIGALIRGIVSGSSFTNKIDKNGMFNESANLHKLLDDARSFYSWTKSVNKHILAKRCSESERREIMADEIVLYRHIGVDDDKRATPIIHQPIPMSCTWSIDFATEWSHGKCCVYEIHIPATDVFLPLSMPPDSRVPADCADHQPANQSQYEVTVAPCRLTLFGVRKHGPINVYQYNARTCSDDADVIANFTHVEQHGCFDM